MQLLGWAWRMPFWLSAVVVVVAYVIRRKLEEPPAFLDTEAIHIQLSPLKQAGGSTGRRSSASRRAP